MHTRASSIARDPVFYILCMRWRFDSALLRLCMATYERHASTAHTHGVVSDQHALQARKHALKAYSSLKR